MQRKTNIFYTEGNDSNFITFSNYTEALTANFLATDWKLYPDKFLCLYIPNLNEETKKQFIEYLAAYYENKLAFLRDKYVEQNENIENHLYPLNFLLEAIKKFDENAQINYIGDVTEQDYNGIYSDTICTIDSANVMYDYILNNVGEDEYSENDDTIACNETEYLYGWSKNGEYKGVSEYEEVLPIFDTENEYRISPIYRNISRMANPAKTDIQFNIIIPLFVVMDINHETNDDVINEEYLNLIEENENVNNVPIGIWFANDTVVLKRQSSKYAPAWSLVLSSQFKPYPYSDPVKYPTELSDHEATKAAYATFAQILAKQNDIFNKFSEIESSIAELSDRVEAIQLATSNVPSTTALDNMSQKISYISDYIDTLALSMQMNNAENNLKWKTQF